MRDLKVIDGQELFFWRKSFQVSNTSSKDTALTSGVVDVNRKMFCRNRDFDAGEWVPRGQAPVLDVNCRCTHGADRLIYSPGHSARNPFFFTLQFSHRLVCVVSVAICFNCVVILQTPPLRKGRRGRRPREWAPALQGVN